MKTIALVCVVMCLTFGMASSHYYYGKGLMSVLSKQAEALYRGLSMVSSEDGDMLTSHHDYGYHGYHGHRHRVAFTAVTSSSSTYSSGTAIPFNYVRANYGQAYNSGNYRFTAPSNGLYVFSWGIGTHSSYYGYTKLVKNGSTYHKARCSSGYQQCGATVTIILHKHDQVWLASDYSSIYVYATISFFSGWKLN